MQQEWHGADSAEGGCASDSCTTSGGGEQVHIYIYIYTKNLQGMHFSLEVSEERTRDAARPGGWHCQAAKSALGHFEVGAGCTLAEWMRQERTVEHLSAAQQSAVRPLRRTLALQESRGTRELGERARAVGARRQLRAALPQPRLYALPAWTVLLRSQGAGEVQVRLQHCEWMATLTVAHIGGA